LTPNTPAPLPESDADTAVALIVIAVIPSFVAKLPVSE